MNRRGFIKGAAGLVLVAGAGGLLVPERRVWALDRTMVVMQEAPCDGAAFDEEVRRLSLYYKRGIERHILSGEELAPDVAPYFGHVADILRQRFVLGVIDGM